MHRSRVIGLRIAVSAALGFGFLFAALGTSSNLHIDDHTAYAFDATPTPSSTLAGLAGRLTPTPVAPVGGAAPAAFSQPPLPNSQPTSATQPAQRSQPPNVGAPPAPAPPSPLQQTSDQIASISQQVTQAVQDPSLSIDAKVQQINSLAAQFNQLVGQWQQQLAQTSGLTGGATGNPNPGAPPMPLATPTPTVLPTVNHQGPPGGPTADQLRAQIADVSQQMAQVSQDASLSPEAKTAQLSTLGAEFNQLMFQLQQLGG